MFTFAETEPEPPRSTFSVQVAVQNSCALDVDFTVPGLMAGIFGTRVAMARRAGQATSPAKAAAARKNGRKGGRPPRRTVAR